MNKKISKSEKRKIRKEVKELFNDAQKIRGYSDPTWDDDAWGYMNVAKRQLEDNPE